MMYQGSYSFLFSESESRLGKIGVKIDEYERLVRFINDSPIKEPKPHITEKQRLEQGQPVKEYYLDGLSSGAKTYPGPVSYVIEGVSYFHNRRGFWEFWSKLSIFTEPFSFKHSSRGDESDDHEYIVTCNKGIVKIHRLMKRDRQEPERVEEYSPNN